MPTPNNKFAWYELMTTESGAAEKFYTEVVRWTARDSGMQGMKYTLWSAAGIDIGGLMDMPPEMRAAGTPPTWMAHIGVANADEATASVTEAGGKTQRPPADIPGVGRFAVVSDPQGAGFMLFAPAPGSTPPTVAPGTPGHAGWHELHTTDLESAFAFYSGQFGWARDAAIDMGPVGTYQIFAADGAQYGGMMKMMPHIPTPFWLFYFNVDDIDTAAARVTAAGGTVLHGPVQVPGGSWIINGQDPQGAMFALVGPKI